MYKEKVHIEEIDETFCRLNCDKGALWQLCENFKYLIPSAKYHPLVKNKIWDGYIRHINYKNALFYKGLVFEIAKYCVKNNMDCTIDSSLKDFVEFDSKTFIESLNLKFTPYEHQQKSIEESIKRNRRLILSPTGSGKSLIMYCIMRYYVKDPLHVPLFVVPFKGLVDQLPLEFLNYSDDYEFLYCKIYEGEEKYFYKNDQVKKEELEKISLEKQIPIVYFSTWQSIYKRKKSWFEQFDSIFGDEVHRFVAKSLQTMMEKLPHCKYRFGFTGTLDETKTNELTLVGLFGPIYNTITAKELIDKDLLAQMEISCFTLQYDENTKKEFKQLKNDYQKEVELICKNEKRNNFILNIAKNTSKSSLFLFNFVDNHGKPFFKKIIENVKDKNLFFLYGGTPTVYRNHVKTLLDCDEQIIFEFEDFDFHSYENQEIKLKSGKTKLAQDVTIHDDIDENFLKKYSSINNFK